MCSKIQFEYTAARTVCLHMKGCCELHRCVCWMQASVCLHLHAEQHRWMCVVSEMKRGCLWLCMCVCVWGSIKIILFNLMIEEIPTTLYLGWTGTDWWEHLIKLLIVINTSVSYIKVWWAGHKLQTYKICIYLLFKSCGSRKSESAKLSRWSCRHAANRFVKRTEDSVHTSPESQVILQVCFSIITVTGNRTSRLSALLWINPFFSSVFHLAPLCFAAAQL